MNDMNNLSWSKGIFKCAYQLFNNGEKVGFLMENQWNMSAIGQIGGRNVNFRMRNGWQSRTEIVDRDNHEVIGHIRYNCWLPGAKITLGQQVYRWSFRNIWSTKWKITASGNEIVKYSGYACRGQANSEIDNNLVALSGLFIGNYYWQMMAIYFACLIVPFSVFLF